MHIFEYIEKNENTLHFFARHGCLDSPAQMQQDKFLEIPCSFQARR